MGFPGGSAGIESCNVGDLGSILGLGRSLGEGKGYPLQYSGLGNPMDYIGHAVTKSQTQLSDFYFHFCVTNIYAITLLQFPVLFLCAEHCRRVKSKGKMPVLILLLKTVPYFAPLMCCHASFTYFCLVFLRLDYFFKFCLPSNVPCSRGKESLTHETSNLLRRNINRKEYIY